MAHTGTATRFAAIQNCAIFCSGTQLYVGRVFQSDVRQNERALTRMVKTTGSE